jgi:hypothetical protein
MFCYPKSNLKHFKISIQSADTPELDGMHNWYHHRLVKYTATTTTASQHLCNINCIQEEEEKDDDDDDDDDEEEEDDEQQQ